MKITVMTNKLEILSFDAEAWTVDDGYLWINNADGESIGTFAPGTWAHVTSEEAP